ncbi:MAG: protease htpX [Methanobacteriaceae archaeon]|nr:protease htpX [Methanobacteriaceae archaeon]
MVSNDEIKRRLAEKRSPGRKRTLTGDDTLPSDELKEKFREKRNKRENKNPGYLVCDNCGGYYELQPGESPEDFADECDCGGKLEHANSLDVV